MSFLPVNLRSRYGKREGRGRRNRLLIGGVSVCVFEYFLGRTHSTVHLNVGGISFFRLMLLNCLHLTWRYRYSVPVARLPFASTWAGDVPSVAVWIALPVSVSELLLICPVFCGVPPLRLLRCVLLTADVVLGSVSV